MLKETKYLDYDDEGLLRVGCMKCNTTVATRQGKDGNYRLVHQSHSKRKRVWLQDGSYADLIVCAKCLNHIVKEDFPRFEKTMAWGWREDSLKRTKTVMPKKEFDALIKYKKIQGDKRRKR